MKGELDAKLEIVHRRFVYDSFGLTNAFNLILIERKIEL